MTFTGHVQNGVVVFEGVLPPEGATVDVIVRETGSLEGLATRLQAANSLEKFFKIAAEYPEKDDSNFFQGINASRGPGERLPYPPELKGKTW